MLLPRGDEAVRGGEDEVGRDERPAALVLDVVLVAVANQGLRQSGAWRLVTSW